MAKRPIIQTDSEDSDDAEKVEQHSYLSTAFILALCLTLKHAHTHAPRNESLRHCSGSVQYQSLPVESLNQLSFSAHQFKYSSLPCTVPCSHTHAQTIFSAPKRPKPTLETAQSSGSGSSSDPDSDGEVCVCV